MSKEVTFSPGTKKQGNGKKVLFRRGKSLLGPLPDCTFGPKAVTRPDFTRDYTLDPENQKLTWTRPPESVLIVKKTSQDTDRPFKSLAKWLIEEKKLQVYVEPKVLANQALCAGKDLTSVFQKLKSYHHIENTTFNSNLIDLVITVGGDGTLLYAASLFQSSMPPVIAFHSGSLGFLTAHDFNGFKETIDLVLAGNAMLMLRSRMRCTVHRNVSPSSSLVNVAPVVDSLENFDHMRLTNGNGANGNTELSCLILNEVVVNRGTSQYLCNIDLYLEGRRITSVQGDGLIISTPTGSTAYAVAAGASMVHPDVPSIMITPICPHSLSFRPIIVPSGAELKFTVSENARGSAFVSFDGRETVEIQQGDYVTVRTSVHPTPCVCKSNPFDDWFDSLSQCLHWNSRQPQKKLDDRKNTT